MDNGVELLNEVLSYLPSLKKWEKKPESLERKQLSKLHGIMYGEELGRDPGCGCVADFARVLQGSNKEKLTRKIVFMSEKKFILTPGKVLESFAISEPLTQHSSDEECVKLLASNPKLISKFKSYPNNWQELVDEYLSSKPKKGKKVEEATTEEATTEEATTEEATTEEATTEEATTEEATTEEATTEEATADATGELIERLKGMNEKELRAYANDNRISLKGKTGKNQILEIITIAVNDF